MRERGEPCRVTTGLNLISHIRHRDAPPFRKLRRRVGRPQPKLDFLITKLALRCIISEAETRARITPVSCNDDDVDCLEFQRGAAKLLTL